MFVELKKCFELQDMARTHGRSRSIENVEIRNVISSALVVVCRKADVDIALESIRERPLQMYDIRFMVEVTNGGRRCGHQTTATPVGVGLQAASSF